MDDVQKEYVEKRASLRVDMEAERVLLTWQDSSGQVTSDDAICIDFARKGALLEYKTNFALGSLLEVTFHPNSENENTVKGQVCRCTKCNDLSFHVAVQLV
ncbi:PilZ domain-containing protein [Shewanella gelidii]|nr:PilZ domain-containing protein [Shewanella gelidii]MCL1097500.1 PilZ domain-containing protein [Shewanella gelidii]